MIEISKLFDKYSGKMKAVSFGGITEDVEVMREIEFEAAIHDYNTQRVCKNCKWWIDRDEFKGRYCASPFFSAQNTLPDDGCNKFEERI